MIPQPPDQCIFKRLIGVGWSEPRLVVLKACPSRLVCLNQLPHCFFATEALREILYQDVHLEVQDRTGRASGQFEDLLFRENRKAEAMKGCRTNCVYAIDPQAGKLIFQIARGCAGEGHGKDTRWSTLPFLDKPCYSTHHRERLSGAWAGEYVDRRSQFSCNLPVNTSEISVPSRHDVALR